MKTFIFIIAIFPIFAIAQTTDQPIKKSNQIIIETTDQPDIAFQQIVSLLISEGYILKQSDKELGIITTEPRKLGKVFFYIVQFNVLVDRSEGVTKIIFSGNYADATQIHWNDGTTLDLSSLKNEINFSGMEKSFIKRSWKIMEGFAVKYPDGVIFYRKA